MKRAFVLLALVVSCLRPAEERSRAEDEIGHAAVADLRLDVEGGTAAIRALAPRSVRLWASQPSFRAELHAGTSSGTWRIVVENTLADAELTARGDTPLSLRETGESRAIPTERVYEVELAAGARVELTLAPTIVPGPGERFRFLAYGDVQDAIDRVQDIYRSMNEVPDARFALIVGDLVESGTREQLERFRVELRGLRMPVYATLGNHELGADEPPAYYAFYGRGTHGFRFGDVAFTMVDSASATIDPITEDRIQAQLDANRDRLHVVGMHIPPVDPIGVRNGAFASHAEAQRLLGKLAAGGVDLTLYGHVHSYYAFANAGIPAFITGGGGAIPERFDAIGRHYLIVDADPTRSTLDVALARVDR